MSPPKRQPVHRRQFLGNLLTTLATAPLGVLACSSLPVGMGSSGGPVNQ